VRRAASSSALGVQVGRWVSRANLAFAATVIVGLAGWDLLGSLSLALGVAGHELSTVIVCLNGLRLLASTGQPPQPLTAAPAPNQARSDDELRSPINL
jgi:hypothetical protein